MNLSLSPTVVFYVQKNTHAPYLVLLWSALSDWLVVSGGKAPADPHIP